MGRSITSSHSVSTRPSRMTAISAIAVEAYFSQGFQCFDCPAFGFEPPTSVGKSFSLRLAMGYRTESKSYLSLGALVAVDVSKILILFVNAENFTDVRQTKYDPLVLPARARAMAGGQLMPRRRLKDAL